MVCIQDVYEILWEVLRKFLVAVCDMGDEINKVSKRDNASSACRGRRLHEYISLMRILGKLVDEVSLVGPVQVLV